MTDGKPAAAASSGLTTRLRTAARTVTSDTALTLGAITLLGLAIRLYRLDGLPAEMWGDVVTHYQLAQQVMSGHPYVDYEFGGDGAMFSYCVSAVAAVAGLSFFTLKLTTVLIGTAVVAATYFLAEALFDNRQIGLIAALVTAISFWDITFSRQAKPYILVALLTCVAVTFAARRKTIPASIALGLGMYTQAAFWGVPVAFIIMPTALLVGALVATPVIDSFIRGPNSLFGSSSYIGSKLHVHHSLTQTATSVLANIWKNALSFNVRGDATFRHNIPLHPHLDVLSGVLFLAGISLILWQIVRMHDWKLLWWFVIPFMAALIPSVLDTTPGNVPNMGRTIGVMPFAYTAVAYAIYVGTIQLFTLLKRTQRAAIISSGLAAIVMVMIFCVNAYNYFVIYPRTLPNGNTPFDRIIADRANASPNTYSVLIGCCWGDWGQPQPLAVLYRTDQRTHLLEATDLAAARDILRSNIPRRAQVILYLDPHLRGFLSLTSLPLRVTGDSVLRDAGWDVAWTVRGTRI